MSDPKAGSIAPTVIAFGLSGALAGFAGGLYVHFLPINVDAVYLDLSCLHQFPKHHVPLHSAGRRTP